MSTLRRACTAVTLLLAACDSSPAPTDASAIRDTSDDLAPTDVVTVDAPAVVDAPADAGAQRCTRALSVERVEDLGAFSLPSDAVLSRDGVSSGLFRGRVAWTFGDTFLTRRNPIDNSSVLSATAGWSRADAPLTLDEPVDDAGFPNQLIPYTDDELRANRADALNGWALWPGAVIDTGTPEALVLFQRIKRTNGSGFDSLGVGAARLTEGSTLAVRSPGDLFPGAADASVPVLYGSGGASVLGDTVYLFACGNVGFLNQGCRVARAPRARAGERAAYEFFDGARWVADISRAAVVIEQVGGGVSVSLNPHLGCYLAVTGGTLHSSIILRTSERLESGWGRAQSGVTIEATADGGVLPAPEGYDYLFLEHPALRSADGRQVVVSYSRPLGNFRGEVRLVRITLGR